MKTSPRRSSQQELTDAKRHRPNERKKENGGQSKYKAAKSLKVSGSTKSKRGSDSTPICDNQDYGSYSEQSESASNEAEERSPYNTFLNSLHGRHKQRKLSARRKISKDRVANELWITQVSLKKSSQEIDLESDIGEESNGSEKEVTGDENTIVSSDPFYWHFVSGFPDVASRLAAVKSNSWASVKPSHESNICIQEFIPRTLDAEGSFSGSCSLPANLWLKHRLFKNYEEIRAPLDALSLELSKRLLRYHDILYGRRTTSTANNLRIISCLHALNHVYKTRDRLLRNTEKRAHMNNGQELELRDQGFTRPKVLFLLETRQNCFKYASIISSLAKPEQEEHKKRFTDNFYLPENKFSTIDPEDFRDLFEGNDDNNFRLGLKLTRKTMKYFANFYSADIIFASPLGLRSAIEAKVNKDYDFLSSIEILFIDQADAMLMQNWEHVEFVLDHLNLQPTEAHGCDFTRLRSWYLDGDAQYYRQTVVYSAFVNPDINKVFSKHMKNIAGKSRFQPTYRGVVLDLDIRLKQIFYRLNPSIPEKEPEVRFEAFTSVIIPSITKLSSQSESYQGILIFIPSYLDFVRIRNFMLSSSATNNLSFGAISEYSELAEVRRARSLFVDGRYKVLLYTGRAHHFRRYHLQGVREVVMYALPENASFYLDIVGGYIGSSIADGQIDDISTKVRILFSKWDMLKLERVVGTERMKKMLKENLGDIFEFQ